MFKTDHITALMHVGYYQAPSVPSQLGARIPPFQENIEVLIGGNVYFDVGGQERLFGAGTIFWHLPGEMTIQKNVPDNPYECLVLNFQLKAEIPRQVPEVTIMRQPDQIKNLSSELLVAFHDNKFNNNILGQYIYHRFLWEAYSASRHPVAREYPRPLRLVLNHIHTHYGKDLLIDDLAKKGGVSSPYLYTLFKKHLRVSPHQYLLTIRLKEACALLAGTTQRIKKISDECGFMNPESFCRNFKKAYKMTPGKFREKSYPY